MIKKYWTHVKTDKYDIYLTSRTVYICDKDGRKIKKFKDLNYAYKGCVSNNQELLVVKSSEGRMAIYSLVNLELIKKIRFSKIDGSQDDNFIFTPDDKYLINIERHVSSTKTALSIYNITDFSLVKRLFDRRDDLVLSVIEHDKESNEYFILGFLRDLQTRVANKFFVARLFNDELHNTKIIDEKLYGFLCSAKAIEFAGFTEESYNWWFIYKTVSLNELKLMDLSLFNFWKEKTN